MSQSPQSDVVPLPAANGPHAPSSDDVEAPRCDPLGPFVQGVLALFSGPLAEVRFADVDRETLEALAQRVCAEQREVEVLEQRLEDARAQLERARRSLLDRANRALAYARIYATGDPALEEAIAALHIDSKSNRAAGSRTDGERADGEPGGASRAPRRRGRPRREASAGALLPMDVAPAEG